MQRIWLMVVLLGLATACGSPPAASPSMADPSGSLAADQGLPPGCQVIDLRSPTGEAVDLTGVWAGDGILAGHDSITSGTVSTERSSARRSPAALARPSSISAVAWVPIS
jgi:hypothetical protein